jgi:predicted porin
MKYRALWCAALSAFAVSQAHAEGAPTGDSVTIYGLIDAGVSYVSNEGVGKNIKFDDGALVPNLFGFRGIENLGGGVRAVFSLVNQFTLGTGSTLAGQGLFGRNAFVGLVSDNYGSVTLGNQYDFMTDSLFSGRTDAALEVGGLYNFRAGPFSRIGIPANPPFAQQFDWDRMAGATVSSSLKYKSPSVGGFRFGALYGFGGVPGSLGSGNSVSFGVNYDNGPFGMAAAYTEVKYLAAGAPEVGIRNWGVGGHYQFANVSMMALLTTVRNTSNGGAIAEGEVGLNWLFQPEWQVGADYMYMKGDAFLNNNHAHQITAILDYLLSKRTTVYIEGVYQRANHGARALIAGVLDPYGTSSGPSQFIARVAVETRF